MTLNPNAPRPTVDQVLPGAENADDGVIVDADVVRHERLGL